MTNVNPITTPVLDSSNDQPICPNVYDGPPINDDYSNPIRLTFAPETIVPYESNRHAANDGEVTAVHGADEIRTVLVDEPETPGLLLREYDDLRGRITRSRQVTIDEISARVVGELTKRLAQTGPFVPIVCAKRTGWRRISDATGPTGQNQNTTTRTP